MNILSFLQFRNGKVGKITQKPRGLGGGTSEGWIFQYLLYLQNIVFTFWQRLLKLVSFSSLDKEDHVVFDPPNCDFDHLNIPGNLFSLLLNLINHSPADSLCEQSSILFKPRDC